MNTAAPPVMRATHEPVMPFARHQCNSQLKSTLLVVISGDGDLLTSTSSSVASEMLPVRTKLVNSLQSIIKSTFY